jgi:hypothetical protein
VWCAWIPQWAYERSSFQEHPGDENVNGLRFDDRRVKPGPAIDVPKKNAED